MQYVDLVRRFRDLTQEELEDPELLAYYGGSRWGQRLSDGWADLLACPRVILVAEAGSGKSVEMREQVRRLRAEGKSAFFFDLDALDRCPLTDLLRSTEDERSLEAWKSDDKSSTAWFFLDAVDELKLTGGKLRRALERLGRAIDGLLHRAHILISCRPTDWRPDHDMAVIQEVLPIPPSQPSLAQGDADPFLAPLRKRDENGKSKNKVWTQPRVVVLLPLSDQKPIAAWLALWDEDTRRELMAREPEALLSLGDPESLQAARADLLQAFARQYGDGGWRGFSMPFDKVHRLASPEMGPVVRKLWAAGQKSPDVREILLAIIWHGRIAQCEDIAREVAFDESQDDTQRVFAVRALATCGSRLVQKEMVSSILDEPERWPSRVIHAVASDIFPSLLSVGDLITLARRTTEPKSRSDVSWALKQIAEAIDVASDLAVRLRDALTELIWQGRNTRQEWYDWKGQFDYATPALALLCERQLSQVVFSDDTRLVRACVVANRFATHADRGDEAVRKLRQHFELPQSPREIAFWTEVELMSKIAPTEDYINLYIRSEHESVIWRLTAGDRPWLLKALRASEDPVRRLVALQALLRLWYSSGRDQSHLNELISAVQDDARLLEALHEGSKPPEEDKLLENWQRERRIREEEAEINERLRLDKWLEWKQSLLDDPGKSFGSAEVDMNLFNICSWLESQANGSRLSVWDWNRIRQAFGDESANRIVDAFAAFWRAHPPRLPSRQPSKDREDVMKREALTGLAAEARIPGWATRLTTAEARIAAGYAAIEINAFPIWLKDLVSAHPDVVEEVIGGEVESELSRVGESQYLAILQNLSYADIGVKRLLAPRLFPKLEEWPTVISDESFHSRAQHQLDQVLGLVIETIPEEDKGYLAALCERKFFDNSRSPMALAWLRALFQLDPVKAVEAFEGELASISGDERSTNTINAFADLFGDRRTRLNLAAVHGEQKAVIEVKIADTWTLTQLEHALRAQLVGQYLRHETCKAGCLLLTHNGTRTSWKHPKTRQRLSFPEVIEYLKASAQAIEEEQRFEVRLLVFPLDLTDPSRQS